MHIVAWAKRLPQKNYYILYNNEKLPQNQINTLFILKGIHPNVITGHVSQEY